MSIEIRTGKTASREISRRFSCTRSPRGFSGLKLPQADLVERHSAHRRKCPCRYLWLLPGSLFRLHVEIVIGRIPRGQAGRTPRGPGGRALTRRPPRPPLRSPRPPARGDRQPACTRSAQLKRMHTHCTARTRLQPYFRNFAKAPHRISLTRQNKKRTINPSAGKTWNSRFYPHLIHRASTVCQAVCPRFERQRFHVHGPLPRIARHGRRRLRGLWLHRCHAAGPVARGAPIACRTARTYRRP